jgi:uncharacterized membrane protein YGL010W
MIVLAVTMLLSRPGFEIAGLALNPAWLAIAATGVYYIKLDTLLGIVLSMRKPLQHAIEQQVGPTHIRAMQSS